MGSMEFLRSRPAARERAPEPHGYEVRYHTVHGYRRAFVHAGEGPALLFIHGIGDSSETWSRVLPILARDHTVIAPDLLGHGRSDKPHADYSVAAYANGMRDLLGVLGVDRVTVVGHSLGGGVAMQFAYVLKTDLGRDADDMMRVFDALPDASARLAFVRTLRAVVDFRGQVVTMLDRCYLTRGMPTLLIWGERDAVIPYEHARMAHAAMPGSRLVTFESAGHFPHHSDPRRFIIGAWSTDDE